MTSQRRIWFLLFFSILFISCELLTNSMDSKGSVKTSNTLGAPNYTIPSGKTIADAKVAHESILRSIPDDVLQTIRSNFEVFYVHSSHGTHVSFGAFGLPGFKSGYSTKFAVNSQKTGDNLVFQDYRHSQPSPYTVCDLSTADANWDKWLTDSRTWLENNQSTNVFMWSWCDITRHNVEAYCNAMETLIGEYGQGGSKVGPGKARQIPVHFIFMTGHAVKNANIGQGLPKNQADYIINFCKTRGYFCLDYYSIDTTTMDGVYYEDTDDNGNSARYGGNFYLDWQNKHTKGIDWYENKSSPNGSVETGSHNTQHITANRKAYVFWWILARLTGWDGQT